LLSAASLPFLLLVAAWRCTLMQRATLGRIVMIDYPMTLQMDVIVSNLIREGINKHRGLKSKSKNMRNNNAHK
jgi:hypothetical protein